MHRAPCIHPEENQVMSVHYNQRNINQGYTFLRQTAKQFHKCVCSFLNAKGHGQKELMIIIELFFRFVRIVYMANFSDIIATCVLLFIHVLLYDNRSLIILYDYNEKCF